MAKTTAAEAALVDLDSVNRMDRGAFVSRLGGVFEHSPWVAERAWRERPFASREALHEAMMRALRAAAREQQLALLRAHPEVAGREATAGELTADSGTEQARLGFTALDPAELERVAQLNRAYRETFGFPAIVALALHRGRDTVYAEIERRTANSPDTELAAGLDQVAHISYARLGKLLAG